MGDAVAEQLHCCARCTRGLVVRQLSRARCRVSQARLHRASTSSAMPAGTQLACLHAVGWRLMAGTWSLRSEKDTCASHGHTHPRGKSAFKALQWFQAVMLWKMLAGRSILYTRMMPRDQDREEPFLLPELDDTDHRKPAHLRTCYMDALGPQRTCLPFPARQNCIKLGEEGFPNLVDPNFSA